MIACLSFSSEQKTVYIQPLGKVHAKYIKVIDKAISNFYGFTCTVLPAIPNDPSLYAKSKTRYDASKILDRFKSNDHVVVITEKDIAAWKSSNKPEWGIFGLGSMVHKTCVVSTYRLKPDSLVSDRLVKVTLHEIGHNLGLSHCVHDDKCLMNAAKGTIKQVDKEAIYFCSHCRNKLIK